VLCGRDDAWATYERHADMQRLVAGSRLVAVDDCGHMVTMERPAETAAALAAWLDE
jgi:pimeloyl-ACP methyl ester carboxylesterase